MTIKSNIMLVAGSKSVKEKVKKKEFLLAKKSIYKPFLLSEISSLLIRKGYKNLGKKIAVDVFSTIKLLFITKPFILWKFNISKFILKSIFFRRLFFCKKRSFYIKKKKKAPVLVKKSKMLLVPIAKESSQLLLYLAKKVTKLNKIFYRAVKVGWLFFVITKKARSLFCRYGAKRPITVFSSILNSSSKRLVKKQKKIFNKVLVVHKALKIQEGTISISTRIKKTMFENTKLKRIDYSNMFKDVQSNHITNNAGVLYFLKRTKIKKQTQVSDMYASLDSGSPVLLDGDEVNLKVDEQMFHKTYIYSLFFLKVYIDKSLSNIFDDVLELSVPLFTLSVRNKWRKKPFYFVQRSTLDSKNAVKKNEFNSYRAFLSEFRKSVGLKKADKIKGEILSNFDGLFKKKHPYLYQITETDNITQKKISTLRHYRWK